MNYAGFWQRFGAYWLDVICWLPLTAVLFWLNEKSRLAHAVYFTPLLFIGAWYHIYLVKRYGGTPGKLLLNLRIVRTDGSAVGYKEAFLRHLPLLILGSLVSFSVVMASMNITDAEYFRLGWKERHLRLTELAPEWYGPVVVIQNIWVWSEFVVMMTNRKRRALHDFIAGTVVISTKAPAYDLALRRG